MSASARRRTDRRPSRAACVRGSASAVAGRLVRLAQALGGGDTLEAALAAVADASREITRSSQASLRLHDVRGRRLLVAARSGPSVHRGGSAPRGVGDGLLGWVARHRRPLLANRGARDRRFLRRPGQAWDPSAVVAVPLLAGRACIGVLSAARRDRRPYTPTDLRHLELVAALSTARLEAARVERLAETDPLTRLPNRRHLAHRLRHELDRCRRARRPLALVLLDVDDFGRFNRRHGVDVGDAVLRRLAARLRGAIRQGDVVARWGGEEFLVILPGADARAARRVAERLRAAVADAPFPTRAGPQPVTASFGVAASRSGCGAFAIVIRANVGLKCAKIRGKNCVEVAPAGPGSRTLDTGRRSRRRRRP